jgi:hypothetical protein
MPRDPKGPWYSPTKTQRRSPQVGFTCSPEALDALAFLAPGAGEKSSAISAAIVERARRLGWTGPDEKKIDPSA